MKSLPELLPPSRELLATSGLLLLILFDCCSWRLLQFLTCLSLTCNKGQVCECGKGRKKRTWEGEKSMYTKAMIIFKVLDAYR